MHVRTLFAGVAAALLAVPAGAQLPQTPFGVSVDPNQQDASLITVAKRSGGGYPGGSAFPTPNPPTGQTDPRYATPFGTGFDGVVRLFMKDASGTVISGCSGSLLAGGVNILTAAHCISNGTSLTAASVDVGFLNSSGTIITIQSDLITYMSGYTGSVVDRRDLAVIRLSTGAPPWATQYGLFTGDPRYQAATFAGYGLSGDGLTGGVLNSLFSAVPNRYKGLNSWDSSRDATSIYTGGSTVTGGILVSDFDGSSASGAYPRVYTSPTLGNFQLSYGAVSANSANSLCRAWGVSPLTPVSQFNPAGLTAAQISQVCSGGYGQDEVMIGSGDSGGPGFITVGGEMMIAGVASFGSQRCVPAQNPAVTVANAACIVGSIGGIQIPGVLNGSYFGSQAGHVFVGQDDALDFITSYNTTPEPATYVLMGSGLVLVGLLRRRRSA